MGLFVEGPTPLVKFIAQFLTLPDHNDHWTSQIISFGVKILPVIPP